MDFSSYLGIAHAFISFFKQNSFEILTRGFMKVVCICKSILKYRLFEILAAYHSFIWAYDTVNGDQWYIIATIGPPISIRGAYMMSL